MEHKQLMAQQVKEMLTKYGEIVSEGNSPTTYYEIVVDLGLRTAHAYILNDTTVAMGLHHGNLHFTQEAKHYFNKTLKDFENDIIEWQKEHTIIN